MLALIEYSALVILVFYSESLLTGELRYWALLAVKLTLSNTKQVW